MQYTYLARNKKETGVSLEESGIRLQVWSRKKGEQCLFYTYGAIKRVCISISDMEWHTVKIRFSDGREILLRSLTFGCREHGRVISKPAKQSQVYRELVLELHRKLIALDLSTSIKFRQGSNIMATLCLGMAAACIFGFIPMAWSAGYYWLLAFFILGVLVLVLFALKTGFERLYDPRAIPEKYLPKSSDVSAKELY